MIKEEKKFVIAIDGGAGVGKSSVAKLISKKTKIMHIDTGAMYRAVGLYFKNSKIDIIPENEEIINNELKNIDIRLEQDETSEKNLKIILNNEDVTKKIRTPEVSMLASDISKFKKIREVLVALQRKIAGNNNVVLDGRDIASVVFPNATLKIFLTTSILERTNRRLKELLEKGENVTFDEVKTDLEKRDFQDSTRKESPLIKVEDAIEIETSNKSIEEVCDIITLLLEKKGFSYDKNS
jgi:cytidylate kinase